MGIGTDASGAPAAVPTRAEHDALAARLEVRRSIDELRKGLWVGFFGLLSVGLTIRLAWDRWGTLKPGVVRKLHRGPPLLVWLATAAAIVALVLTIRFALRARRLMREEDALWARFLRIRAALRLDP